MSDDAKHPDCYVCVRGKHHCEVHEPTPSSVPSGVSLSLSSPSYSLLDDLRADPSYYHLKARAECLPDVVEALNLIVGKQSKHFPRHKVIAARVTSDQWGAEFDFWTTTPMKMFLKIWDEEGCDLHVIVSSAKTFEAYDGLRNNGYYHCTDI